MNRTQQHNDPASAKPVQWQVLRYWTRSKAQDSATRYYGRPRPHPKVISTPRAASASTARAGTAKASLSGDQVTCTKVAGMPSFGHMARASTCGTTGNHMMEIGYMGSRRAKVRLCDCGLLSKDEKFHPHTSFLSISLSIFLSFVSLLINH